MNTQKNKLERLIEHVEASLIMFVDRAKTKRDLDQAMGDLESSAKEVLKIEVMENAFALFQRAKQEKSFELVSSYYRAQLEEDKAKLQAALSEAQASANKEEEIASQIRLGILIGPVEGSFKGFQRRILNNEL